RCVLGIPSFPTRRSSDLVLKWGKNAAKSVGLSSNAYNQSASVVGAMLTNYGVANDKVASSTNSLIGYASDLAAMFGGTTQEAVRSEEHTSELQSRLGLVC